MKHLRLFGLTLALILALCLLAKSQEVRTPNISRIARAWNSLGPATKEWNEAMKKADTLIHDRFNPNIVIADPEAKRRDSVANYKAAKEALLTQLDALNELIDEEDR